MKLVQQLHVHMRASGWSTYQHKIFDDDAGHRLVGYKSSRIPTGRNSRGKIETIYKLATDDRREFDSAESFTKAYQQQLRDEEFDAAAPK